MIKYLSFLTTATLVGASILVSPTVTAQMSEPIPIEEEFVVAQWNYLDTSLDALLTFFLETPEDENLFNFDGITNLTYEGNFEIADCPTCVSGISGGFSGEVSGLFFGETLVYNFNAELEEAFSAFAPPLGWDITSSGEWEGKKFTDKGKIIEKENNKADIEIEIMTEDGQKKTVKGSNLDKIKKDGKLTVKGDITWSDNWNPSPRLPLTPSPRLSQQAV